ncbi:MAG: DegT/DnrJ/EryC1/StrS family aminotransferase [Planctomycetota bacterium]|jgi:dTDP-4-amino-4,6-dideoxygalactose transaminase
MQVPILDLKAQYSTIKNEVMQAINEVCESQSFALGPAVAEFEEKIGTYCASKYAIGVSSGTDALLVGLMALEIKPGDEVITTPFTFFSTAGCIARLGAKPVFVDVEADSYNIDAGLIEEKITEKTRAIIPVHLFGQLAQMKPIMEIAQRYNLAVIEDAAQAIGASQDGIKCGNFGDCGCFSFYPTKNLGGFGDGGLVTTNTESLAERIRILRNHGQNPPYFYKAIGGNFRLDSVQAAVLTVKLRYLDGWTEKRRQNAALYDSIFADSPVRAPEIGANNVSIYHQYTVTVPKRDRLQKFLAENQIGSAIFYPKPLHLQDCFKDLGYRRGDLPVAERLCNEVLSLPVYPELLPEQIEYVARTVLEFHGTN